MNDDFSQKILHRVLIVDDDSVSREMLRFALSDDFEVEEAESGVAALFRVAKNVPDLLMLDIEMPGMSGYDVCRKLRETCRFPIIFVSSHDTLEERIEAFDCGADDFFIKPFDAEILARKVAMAIEGSVERQRLINEKNRMQKTAMGFLSSMSDSGVLMTFMRASMMCVDEAALATNLINATTQYGINCHVQIRLQGGVVTMTPHGIATPLEVSVLDKSKDMGRIFQFKKRMVINYSMVSILVMDVPGDDDIAGRIRDNLCILAESAEAIAENIGMRRDAAVQSEQLQAASLNATASIQDVSAIYQSQMQEGRRLLEKLINEVEESFIFLALTDKQERMVLDIMQTNVHPVLTLFELSEEMEQKFDDIANALQSKKAGSIAPEVWLF